MSLQFPWDYHPSLTSDRLSEVARIIIAARMDALNRHDERIGDNGWTLGCSAYQFARHRITTAADDAVYPWLSLLDRSLHFVFKIGKVPIRFYKGDADDAGDRLTERTYVEFDQLELVFDERDRRRKLLYRFAVETDFEGAVSAIKFVGLDGKRAVLCWDVPYGAATPTAIAAVRDDRLEGVELPPPLVKFPRDRDQATGEGSS